MSGKTPENVTDISDLAGKVERANRILRTIDLSGDLLEPFINVIDGFMIARNTTMSGMWGAGKTTGIVPLAAVVCGAVEYEGITATLKRDVIYFTEHADQVKQILYGLVRHQGANQDILERHFHVVPARQERAGFYKEILAPVPDHYLRPNETPNGASEIPPLIVFDTVSACIALDNESDNTEVATAIDAIDAACPTAPKWLVCHVPKNLRRADARELHTRGAGSWEANVQAVVYLAVEEDGRRYFFAGDGVKRRDGGHIKEIAINGERHTEHRRDRYGFTQEVGYVAINLEVSNEADRLERRKIAREAEARAKENAATEAILGLLKAIPGQRDAQNPALEDYPNKERLQSHAALKEHPRAAIRIAIDHLMEQGTIRQVAVPPEAYKAQGMKGAQKYYEVVQ